MTVNSSLPIRGMAYSTTVFRAKLWFIIPLFFLSVDGYEKTLRKIVRSQTKMVQRPFSESSGSQLLWKNVSTASSPYYFKSQAVLFPGFRQITRLSNKQRPKISTIFSAVDTLRGMTGPSKFKLRRRENIQPIEIGQAQNKLKNNTLPISASSVQFTVDDPFDRVTNSSYPEEADIKTLHNAHKVSRFFPPVDDQIVQNTEQDVNSKASAKLKMHRNISDLAQGIFLSNVDGNDKSIDTNDFNTRKLTEYDNVDSDKIDYLVQEVVPETGLSFYNYSVPSNPYTCVVLQRFKADIDAQEKFSEFDIEPSWILTKHYWNNIFDSRYESLMRDRKWPPLKVILIPRTHVDSVWKQTFERYHNNSVHKILSNLVKKLQFYKNLTFTWNEVSHLSQWWLKTTQKNRSAFRRLLRIGRLEITTGSWVEPDEATTHIFGLVHQFIEGHQWLQQYLNFAPKTAWLTNSMTHSPTVTYLLSACGVSNLILTNIHYSWEKFLAEYQYSDFIWSQGWDNDIFSQSNINDALQRIGNERVPKNSVLTHTLQFNTAGFKACGPNTNLCESDFNFAKAIKNIDSYNVKEKSEILLEQYSKTGTITPHNVIIAPLGGSYHYELQTEYDFQYNNYQKIADFVNANREIYKATVQFGTPVDYFKAITEKNKLFPTLKGDFLNFADINSGKPAYWSGFFTTRPLLKILLRRLESTLRTTEILFSFAISSNAFKEVNVTELFNLLLKARETVARLLDRNVYSGTLTSNVIKYVHKQILLTVRDCWYIQETCASIISIKSDQNVTYLQKYVYRNGEFISAFRTVTPGDQIYVFNSLSHERTEIVEVVTRNPNIRIIDHNKKDITIQINPIWNYQAESTLKISRQFFAITFAVIVPAMTLELYKIKETYDASASAATIYCVSCVIDNTPGNGPIFPFTIQPIEIGDIQLESYKHRLIFDEITGLLKTVFEKETGNAKTVMIDYGVFQSSHVNSGMFLFNTNASKPIHDFLLPYRKGIKTKIIIIISGLVTTSLTTVFGRLLHSSVKIFNLINGPLSKTIGIETKTDYEASPKNRELELFLSIQTDINNGNPPEIIIDNNGFQYTSRFINISRPIESNMFPLTTMAYLQDYQSRISLMTDHAQGVTTLQEGQLVLMLDRRILFNDDRGTGEGLADNSAAYHRNYILLENFEKPNTITRINRKTTVQLPSLDAVHLSNSLTYQLDMYFIDRSQADLCYYTIVPLIKTPFPCDVFVLNYRLILNKNSLEKMSINSALITLHRQSFSCEIFNSERLNCNSENSFSLEKIFRYVKAVYRTNLCGTNEGISINKVEKGIFAPMELVTFKIYF